MTFTLAAQILAAESTGSADLAGILSGASGPAVVAIVLGLLVSGRLRLAREVVDRDKRIAELLIERDEFKSMSLQLLRSTQKLAVVAEKELP